MIIVKENLVNPKKILFPLLHIKLKLMKELVKVLPEEKLKGGIFVGPHIRKLIKDEYFKLKMEDQAKKAYVI